jgi:hypothetical protein
MTIVDMLDARKLRRLAPTQEYLASPLEL